MRAVILASGLVDIDLGAIGTKGELRSGAEWFDIGTPSKHQRAVEAFERSPELFGS